VFPTHIFSANEVFTHDFSKAGLQLQPATLLINIGTINKEWDELYDATPKWSLKNSNSNINGNNIIVDTKQLHGLTILMC